MLSERAELDDVKISTLRRYREGLGAELELVAVFPRGHGAIVVPPAEWRRLFDGILRVPHRLDVIEVPFLRACWNCSSRFAAGVGRAKSRAFTSATRQDSLASLPSRERRRRFIEPW